MWVLHIVIAAAILVVMASAARVVDKIKETHLRSNLEVVKSSIDLKLSDSMKSTLRKIIEPPQQMETVKNDERTMAMRDSHLMEKKDSVNEMSFVDVIKKLIDDSQRAENERRISTLTTSPTNDFSYLIYSGFFSGEGCLGNPECK